MSKLLLKFIDVTLVNSLNRFDNDTRPALNTIADGLVTATKGASDLLGKANGLVDQINNLLSTANQGSQLANSTSEKLKVASK